MKTDIRTHHLSDAEFSQLLDGAQPGRSAAAHLAACEHCREELDVVQNSLGSFRNLSTTWAVAEAPRRVPVPSRWVAGLHLHTSWSMGLGATAITGVLAFYLGFLGQQPSRHMEAAPILAVAPTTSELAADNRLLSSIDAELDDQAALAMPAAGVRAEAPRSSHPGQRSLTN